MKTVQTSIAPSNYLLTYYQALDEGSWTLRQEKLKKRTNVLKNFENCENLSKNFQN